MRIKGKTPARKYCEVDRSGMIRLYPGLKETERRKRLRTLIRKLFFIKR